MMSHKLIGDLEVFLWLPNHATYNILASDSVFMVESKNSTVSNLTRRFRPLSITCSVRLVVDCSAPLHAHWRCVKFLLRVTKSQPKLKAILKRLTMFFA